MSGIYIPSMEMPTNGHITITISDNGEVVCNSEVIGGKYQYSSYGHRSYGRIGKAIPVPDHGDLIDRDKLEKDIDNYIGGEESRSRFHHWVQVQEAVIPMDKGEEK